MSYLRDPFYVWGDGLFVNIWARPGEDTDRAREYREACEEFPDGVSLPQGVFDALCLMRVAEIEAEGDRAKSERRALKRHGGNLGSAALYARVHGKPMTFSNGGTRKRLAERQP